MAEDEKLEREAVCGIVSSRYPRSVTLHEASNGIEALEIARERDLDAAILDIRMPGLDGLDAAREIRNARPGLPIAFLTACDSFDYARMAVSLGADEYILKPASDEEIVFALDRMLASRRAALEQREGELAKDELLKSTKDYLRREIAKDLSEGRLDPGRAEEYSRMADLGRVPGFLAAYRLPKEKSAAMSPGFRRAVLARVRAHAESSCASRGFEVLSGSTAEYAFILCFADAKAGPGTGGGMADSAKEMIREAQRRAMGDFGVSPLAGAAFPEGCGTGDLPSLLESARGAADLARPDCPVVIVRDDARPCAGTPGDSGNRLVKEALAYMEERLNQDISLGTAAAFLRISPSHLSRLFSGGTGSGFSGALAALRVKKAECLLRSGSSVKETAALVGFRDPAYFARVFRRLAGMSPTEFLENLPGGRGRK